jgi:uncharacterized protein YqeY
LRNPAKNEERKRQPKGGRVTDSREMALKDRIREALKEAVKRRHRVEVSTLRLLLSEIKYAEIAQQKPADDNKVLDVVAREVKRRHESIEAFRRGNRDDLVAEEEAELTVLLGYLPKQMDHDEIVTAARQTIDALGARGPADKGRVMAQLMSQVKGKADGGKVSEIVSELLAAR